MAEPEHTSGQNPKEAAILKLFEDKVEPKVAQVEKESQAQDSLLKKLQAEIDNLIKLGTDINKELDEHAAQDKGEPTSARRGLDMKIDVDDESGKGVKAPQSTRETKTGLIGKNPSDPKNRRLSHQGKTDKTPSLTDVEEQKKEPAQKGGKRPEPPARPGKTENKTEPKAGNKTNWEKKGPGAQDKQKKEPEEEKKENPESTENIDDGQEKTPEQAATAECKSALKGLTKAMLTEACSLASPPTQVIKVFEAVLVAIGEKSQTWITAQKVGKNADFLKRLSEVKAEAITDKNFKKIKQILAEDGMQPDALAKKSAGAKHLGQWLQGLVKLRDILKPEETQEKTEEHNPPAEPAKKENHEEEKKDQTEATEANDDGQEKTPEQAATAECKNALKGLTKAMLTEACSLASPPTQVIKVFEAVLVAIGEKSQTWITAQKVGKNADFLKRLSEVKAEAITDKNFKKIKQILAEDGMQPDALAKKSAGAKHLGQWLHGLVKLRDILKPEEANEKTDDQAEDAEKGKDKEAEPKPPVKKTTTTKKEEKKDDKQEDKDKEKDDKKAPVPKTPAPKTTKADTTKDDKKTAAGKKDDKQEDKEKEKDDKKLNAAPKTPAPKTTKTDPVKDDKKAAGKTAEVKEVKKPDLVHSHPDLKAILDPLTAEEVNDLKAKKIPPPSIATTVSAVCLLTQGKDHSWTETTKTVLSDIASLCKVLDVDVTSFAKKNIEAAEKKLSDKSLEGSVHKAGGAASILFKWVKTAVRLAQGKEGPGSTQDVDKGATTENKEEQKKEEPKEEAQHKEEKPAEEKPAEEKPKEEKPVEEKPKEEAPVVEEKPKEVEHKEEHHEEVKPQVEEPKKEEHVEQSNGHEEHKEGEKAEVHEEKINHEAHANNVESKAEEVPSGNGNVHDNKELVGELNSVLGRDVTAEAGHGDLKEFVNKQIKEADGQLKAVENQIDDFRKDNVTESTDKKPYEIKQSTKEFIQMVQQEWVSELKSNDNWDEKIYQILDLLFLMQGNQDVPDIKDHSQVRSYSIAKLEKEENDLGGYLMGLEKNLNLDIATKVKIQEFLKDKSAILNPSTFDGVDALCGVISFLMKEACEYLGVIPVELAKKAAAKEKILALNLEKNDYLLGKKGKLVEIANKHGISVDE